VFFVIAIFNEYSNEIHCPTVETKLTKRLVQTEQRLKITHGYQQTEIPINSKHTKWAVHASGVN
jgi:hypothetical protein